MIRLIGVDLPKNKQVIYSLTYIHGIGVSLAKKIVKRANIDPEKKINNLTPEEIIRLRETLENSDLKLEGDLRRFNGLNIKRLNEINSYRGKRHRNNLPVRGQRTKTNAQSIRKNK